MSSRNTEFLIESSLHGGASFSRLSSGLLFLLQRFYIIGQTRIIRLEIVYSLAVLKGTMCLLPSAAC